MLSQVHVALDIFYQHIVYVSVRRNINYKNRKKTFGITPRYITGVAMLNLVFHFANVARCIENCTQSCLQSAPLPF